MKKIVLMMGTVLSLLLVACSNESENQPNGKGMGTVSFFINNYEQVSLNAPTRATATSLNHLDMAVYDAAAGTLKPHKVLVCSPCYSGYEQALQPLHPRIVHHSLVARENFDVTDRIVDYIEPEIDLVVLCSPNNPTGRVVSRELLCKVLRAADRWGTKVVVDECFIDLTEENSCVSLMQSFSNLIIVKALTKSHAMAGFRLGYVMSGNPDIVSALREAGAPWAVSSPAQVAGVAALSVPGYLDLTHEYIATERARLEEGLTSQGMLVIPSQTNFILFQSPKPLYEAMLERGFVIRRCENFRGLDDSWFRIAVRTTVENKRFLEALSQVMS